MRAITFSPLKTDSKPLFQSLKILNIFQLHELLVSTFMYDLVKGVLPHSLVDYCQMIQHRYGTRRKESGLLYQPKCKTTQGQFCISFVGAKLWNDLPDEIRLQISTLSFRRHLSIYLLCKWRGLNPIPLRFSFYFTCLPFIYVYTCLLRIIAAFNKLLQDLCMYAHLYDIIFINSSFSFLWTHWWFYLFKVLSCFIIMLQHLNCFFFFFFYVKRLHNTVLFCCIYVNTKQTSFTFIYIYCQRMELGSTSTCANF